MYFKKFQNPVIKRAFFISFMSLFFANFTFTMTIGQYVTQIFDITGSSFSDKNSSILISIITLIGNLVLLSIVDRINRKVSWNFVFYSLIAIQFFDFLIFFYFVIFRHCMLYRRLQLLSSTPCLACTAYCGWNSPNMNGCQYFASHWLFILVLSDLHQSHIL